MDNLCANLLGLLPDKICRQVTNRQPPNLTANLTTLITDYFFFYPNCPD